MLLERFVHDDSNPFIRGACARLALAHRSCLMMTRHLSGAEWAIVAVRNLCEDNAACQAVLAAIERTPASVVASADLDAMGLEVELDKSTGRLVARRRPRPAPAAEDGAAVASAAATEEDKRGDVA